jgi:hypothetical protein
MWTVLGRAIAPASAALQNVNDAADNATIINPLDTASVRWQVGFNSTPLLVTQPK